MNVEHDFDDKESIVPSGNLLQLQMLEKIHLDLCGMVESVFEVEAVKGTDTVKLPNLTEMELERMGNLKYIWKSNQWMTLGFPNLKTLSIKYCEKLEYVFTNSMVGSLLQLQHLHISFCDNMEAIVKVEDDEEECDAAKQNDFILHCLKSIKLERLGRLKGFCLGAEAFSFPSLDTLEIINCPELTVFTNGNLTTPELNAINESSWNTCYIDEDLNSTIKTQHQQQVLSSRR